MNKLLYSFWSLLFMASIVLTTSCGTEEEDVTPAAPSITVTGIADPAAATANVGQAVSFTVSVVAPGGFNVIRVDKTVGTGATADYDEKAKDPGQTITAYSYSFTYTPTADVAGQDVTFDFVIVDDNGKQVQHTFVLTVNEPEMLNRTAVLLGGQKNTTQGSFYNTIDNAIYLMAAAKSNKEKVDFVYYYGATNKATIAAPTSQGAKEIYTATDLTGMTNTTDLVKVTTNFDAITKSSHITGVWAEKVNTSVADQVTDLKVGDVFAFQLASTRGYRIGVAKVTTIEGADYNSTAQKITLHIKMQSVDN
ncbi:hypothetical protein [Cesiribacter sp. SM1]|uniref:hypothetical protein n=1 Tax=Cesiribacter sp. SM1 TaxID=2861196 RepID=UPI001CD6E732|nr:hypothetical protein [Cesiribacter sp. SM1]